MNALHAPIANRLRNIADTLHSPAPQPTNFSIANVVRSMLDGTWAKEQSAERTYSDGVAAKRGVLQRGIYLPDSYLARDLTVASAPGGGYLTANQDGGYLPALQNTSVAGKLGAQFVSIPPGSAVAITKGTTGVTLTWLANEASQIAESQPVMGQIVSTPKYVGGYVEVSRQWLLQTANGEDIVRAELTRAGGVAVDTAVIQGSGASGQPTGILNTASIGAFTGAALSQAALRNAQRDLADANAIVGGALGLATTPTVAEVLSTRQRFTGSDRCLWEGPSHSGIVEGLPAMASLNVPTATAIVGDWSTVWVLIWAGGMSIELDPFTQFAKGIVGIRMLLPIDVIVTRATSFSAATSVS